MLSKTIVCLSPYSLFSDEQEWKEIQVCYQIFQEWKTSSGINTVTEQFT